MYFQIFERLPYKFSVISKFLKNKVILSEICEKKNSYSEVYLNVENIWWNKFYFDIQFLSIKWDNYYFVYNTPNIKYIKHCCDILKRILLSNIITLLVIPFSGELNVIKISLWNTNITLWK